MRSGQTRRIRQFSTSINTTAAAITTKTPSVAAKPMARTPTQKMPKTQPKFDYFHGFQNHHCLFNLALVLIMKGASALAG